MKIICVGDSLTYGYGVSFGCDWVSLLGKVTNMKTVNCGTNGDTSGYILERSQRYYVDEYCEKGDIAIIMGGANDTLTYGATPYSVRNMMKTCDAFSQAGANVIVGIQPGFAPCKYAFYGPLKLEKINENFGAFAELLKAESTDKGLETADLRLLFNDESGVPRGELFSDGVHPTEEGHEMIAECFRAFCEKIIAENSPE